MINRRVAAGVVVALGIGSVAGCGESGTAPPGGTEPAEIAVTVTADGNAESGVTVRLYENGGTSAISTGQTGSNGVAAFGDLEAGGYEVEVEVPAGLELATGQTPRRAVTVATGGSAQVAFALVTEDDDEPGDVVEINLTSSLVFDPSEVTITTGTTVRWTNQTSIEHTVTPRDHSEWSRAVLDQSGETFEHTFQNTGTFDYFCEPHESTMTGTITVQ